MKSVLFLVLISVLLSSGIGHAQERVSYTLFHEPPSAQIHITVAFDDLPANEIQFVIPRSAPGTYDLINYMAYVDQVYGHNTGVMLEARVGEGSYFIFDSEHPINQITYEVDLDKMEHELLGGFSSSKVRTNYLGILGYSIFGFVEGLEGYSLSLNMYTGDNWPIFSTLKPSLQRNSGFASYSAQDFAHLADAQYLLGSNVDILEVQNAPIPLFVASYSETKYNIEEIGRRGLESLKGLADYFGYVPMPHYTMVYEYLIPLSDRHDYGFSMEHLNSMTATADTSGAIRGYDPDANMGSIVHHIGHSWIPLRSYGENYRPFNWQVAPVIETIWLNEGWIWYVAYYYVLEREEILSFFQKILDEAPDFIKQKSLRELSALGSTQYSLDFRIGKNLFARGALFAHALDMEIQKKTDGQKTIREALLALLRWSEEHQSAFAYDQIEQIMSEGVGVDLKVVWDKWQPGR